MFTLFFDFFVFFILVYLGYYLFKKITTLLNPIFHKVFEYKRNKELNNSEKIINNLINEVYSLNEKKQSKKSKEDIIDTMKKLYYSGDLGDNLSEKEFNSFLNKRIGE